MREGDSWATRGCLLVGRDCPENVSQSFLDHTEIEVRDRVTGIAFNRFLQRRLGLEKVSLCNRRNPRLV